MLLYQTLAFTINGKKNKKKHAKIISFTYQFQHRIKNSNYLMDHILYQVCKIIFNIYENTRDSYWNKNLCNLIKIYLNKKENRITFKIKPEYFLEFVMPETMKLIWSSKS